MLVAKLMFHFIHFESGAKFSLPSQDCSFHDIIASIESGIVSVEVDIKIAIRNKICKILTNHKYKIARIRKLNKSKINYYIKQTKDCFSLNKIFLF